MAESEPRKPGTLFVPLFNGAESEECVAVREQLFEEAWTSIESRIQVRPRFSTTGSRKTSEVLIRVCVSTDMGVECSAGSQQKHPGRSWGLCAHRPRTEVRPA